MGKLSAMHPLLEKRKSRKLVLKKQGIKCAKNKAKLSEREEASLIMSLPVL